MSATTETSQLHPDPDVPTTHPTGFWFFFWGELAERSSYYGMRAILPMYLTTVLLFTDTEATPIYSWFKMACYFLPLLGGFLADRFFGRYWTIVGFSVPYVLGHFILGIESRTALVIALMLLAGGSGVIKPNISTLLGQTYDQKRPGQLQLRSAAFMWFYFSVNVGALISMFALPMLRDKYGYAIAFQFPAWLMVISLAVFAAGKPHYALEKVGEQKELTAEERQQRWATLAKLMGIFVLIVFFWVAYEHNDSLWVFFARDYLDLRIPFTEHKVPPDQPQLLNALFVMIFVPLFTSMFKAFDPDVRLFTPTRKILLGFLLTAAAAGIMSAAGFTAKASTEKLSILWLVSAYIILTAGEVLVYGTGLELSYSMAPANMKGFITACFLLTNTLGNFINGFFTTLYGGSLVDPPEKRGPLSPGYFFGITGLIVIFAAGAFLFLNKPKQQARQDG